MVKMMHRNVTTLLLLWIWPVCNLHAHPPEYAPITLPETPAGIHMEILPEIELLSGVLSHTSWRGYSGLQGNGNAYFQDLNEFFKPYARHRAFKIADRLTKKGFTYDAPPHFIASLGPLPNLIPVNGYDDYVVMRAGGRGNLDELRQALADLANKASFVAFWESHQAAYELYLHKTAENFRAKMVVDWLSNFFGWHEREFHLVLAPGLVPGGGYGATIRKSDGSESIYQFIRENGKTEGEPEFPKGVSLEVLSLHEWGHAYIHTAFEKHRRQLSKLDYFFPPVAKLMAKQAYPSPETFFNEQILRAITTFAERELYDEKTYTNGLAYHRRSGFYLTEFTIKQLDHYIGHRDKYRRFDEFLPCLMERYEESREELLKQAKN
jgi:hypothetical protein